MPRDRSVPVAARRAPLTIGQLARAANVSTSMLRFYEREGLLAPAQRSPAGYRLYPPGAEQTLLFIHRAQRLGFALADIKMLLDGRASKDVRGPTVVGIAEHRFLEIERRLTELLVLRHELEMFLEDLTAQVGRSAGSAAGRVYRSLVSHVCGHEAERPVASSPARLMRRLGCALAGVEQEKVFAALRGRHVHVWKDADGYSILVRDRSAPVQDALRTLVAAEAGCRAHLAVELSSASEGLMLSVRGENAFLFAQLFLALEAAA
jgi:DNA-binding transcriptional MerR regulator